MTRGRLEQSAIPDPPQGAVSWVILLGLMVAFGSGGVWVGTIAERVGTIETSLKTFDPLSVDRRLGTLEAQVGEALRILRLQEQRELRSSAPEAWGARPR